MAGRKDKKIGQKRELVGEVMAVKLELSNAQDEIASLEYKLARAESMRDKYKEYYKLEKEVSKAAFAGQRTAQGHADKLRRALYLAAVVVIALGAALGVVANT